MDSPTTLLHISDLHFGPSYVPEVGEVLLRTAEELEPDVVVASGDFTQRAKEEQFAAARQFLDRLPPVPRVVVPGNHDVPLYRVFERFFTPRKLYRRYISEELDSVLELPGLVIVGLDSTSPRRAITNGRIHLDQLEFCGRVFADLPDETVKIVVAHHHFAPAPDYERDQTMPKGRRAIDRFVALDVDLILGGHLHRAYIGNSLDVYAGQERERGVIIVHSGTSTSRRGRAREREKNSFNIVRLDERVIRVTHYVFFDETERFEPISRHIFPRPGHRFLERRPEQRPVGGREGEPVTIPRAGS